MHICPILKINVLSFYTELGNMYVFCMHLAFQWKKENLLYLQHVSEIKRTEL